jgi:hypothetical protein
MTGRMMGRIMTGRTATLLALGLASALTAAAATPSLAQSTKRHTSHASQPAQAQQPGAQDYGSVQSSDSFDRAQGAPTGQRPGQCWYSESGAGVGGQMGYWSSCGQAGGSPNR